MILTLKGGPWFINGYYLSIKCWQSMVYQWILLVHQTLATKLCGIEGHGNLVLIMVTTTPQLPTEYYDHTILAKIGNKFGKLLKTYICTGQLFEVDMVESA